MAKYVKNFVTGHGITFEKSKRNMEAFDKASAIWKEIAASLHLDDNSVIMLCGAKNNGKSSLIRYLVNQYNNPTETSKAESNNEDQDSLQDIDMEDNEANVSDRYAYFLDYDPGQPEMTSSGIVSAHIIKASAPPLQSPTYLNVHQHEPIVMSSIGGTNMSVNPRMYIDNCRYIFNQVKEHWLQQTLKGPIFINTMGYIRNVGLAMLMDLIKICRPTNLIVLNVEADPMRTVYADLSPSAMDNTRASFYYETNQQSQKKLNYKYDVYNLQFSFVDSSSVSTKNRTALQLAYMASIPEALYKPTMQLSAKWLSLKVVSIYCVSSYPLKEGIVLELLHHSWVHLVKLRRTSIQAEQHAATLANTNDSGNNDGTFCKIIDDVSENILFGCGIVADIDLEKKRLAIITPVDQETLDKQVDCVIKPLSIQVPREMIQEGF